MQVKMDPFGRPARCRSLFVIPLVLGILGLGSTGQAALLDPVIVDGGLGTQGFSTIHALSTQFLSEYPDAAGLNAIGRDMLYAYYDGTKWGAVPAWHFDSQVPPSSSRDIALTHDLHTGYPRILFTGYGDSQLHVLLLDPGGWTNETVPDSFGAKSLNLLVDPASGHLWLIWEAIDYGGTSPGTAQFFTERTAPNTYVTEMIDKSVTSLASHTSAQVDPVTGEPCATYIYLPSSSESSTIRFSRRSGTSWVKQDLATGVWSTQGLRLAFAKRGGGATIPQIADRTSGGQIVIHYSYGSGWATETASTTCSEQQISAFQAHPQTGNPILLYTDFSSNLVVTYSNGSTWNTFTVGNSLYGSRLTVSPDGTLTVSNVETVGSSSDSGQMYTYRGPLGSLTKTLAIPWSAPGKSLSASFRPGTNDLWVAYVETNAQQLLLAHWTGWEFTHEVVASSGVEDGVTLLWPSGATKPWIVFSRNGGVELARSTSGGYTMETLAATGSLPAAALNPITGNLTAAFLDGTSVRLARRDAPSSVALETLPASGDADDTFQPQIAFNPHTGDPAVLHWNKTGTAGFSVLQKIGGLWQDTFVGVSGGPKIANLVYDPSAPGWMASIASMNYYSNPVNSDIRPFRWSGGSWVLDSALYEESGQDSLNHKLVSHPVSGNMVCVFTGMASGVQTLLSTEKSGTTWSAPRILAESPDFGSLDAVDAVFSDTGVESYFGHDTYGPILRSWLQRNPLVFTAAHSWTEYR